MPNDNSDPNAVVTAEEAAAFEFEPFFAKEAAAMYHDFSADPWAAECAEHGIALRLAHALLTQTKEKLVEATEKMEKAFPPPDDSPTGQLMDRLRHSRERLAELARILESAEMRQLCAMSVVELRLKDEEAQP
jgi:hypothetical protein